jgi:hypothetical protein
MSYHLQGLQVAIRDFIDQCVVINDELALVRSNLAPSYVLPSSGLMF